MKGMCHMCGEAITNPLCQDCLVQEMAEWMLDKDQDLAEELLDVSVLFKPLPYSEVNCAKCSHEIKLCPYCCRNEVLKLVNLPKDLKKEFKETFKIGIDVPVFT